jgi:hypothetical protein
MKFIYYSDSLIPVEKVIENADPSLFERVENIQNLQLEPTDDQIFIFVLDKTVPDELVAWHDAHLKNKVVLISNMFKETYLRDLQMESNFYDLFFKYPLSYAELEQKLKLISTFTGNQWKNNEVSSEPKLPEPTVPYLNLDENTEDTPIDIASLTDDSETPTLDLQKAETPAEKSDFELNLNTEDLSLANALVQDANPNSSEDLLLGNESEPNKLPEAPAQELSLENQDIQLSENSNDLELNNLFESTEVKDDLSLNVEESAEIEKNLEVEDKNLESEVLEVVAEDEKESKVIENVSLNEILESKDDQIYRLMSKNKLLEDEIIEKEEMIKDIQKQLHDQQSQFEKSRSIVEESNFQMNVLKAAHEQEKNEIKNQLDVANSKIRLLEGRIEELKRSSVNIAKTNDVSLSIGELRKIKARQEHLEEKISLLQSDSAIQLQHREKKIIDLKRKVDLLEFDVRDSLEREMEYKKRIQAAESKMAQMKQILKQAMEEPANNDSGEILKKTGSSYDV